MRQVLVPERRRDCHASAQQALWQLRSVDELDGVPQLGPLRVTGVRIGRENLARQIHTSVPVVPPADNLAIHEARPQGMGVLGAALEQMDDGPGHPLQVLGWVARGPSSICSRAAPSTPIPCGRASWIARLSAGGTTGTDV